MASAAGLPSRLQYTAPEKWTRTTQPDSPVVIFTAPDGNASVTFAESVEFAGSAQEWQNHLWNEIVSVTKPAAQVLPGEQGKFLTRTTAFHDFHGARPWACVYTLVKDGRGEAVLFFAKGYEPFIAHLNAVNQMIHRITVGPATAAAASQDPATIKPNSPLASTPPSTSAIPQNSPAAPGGVDGLYLATTRQLRMNPFGGSGSASWETATEFYLLSRDGRVFRGRDLPQAPNGDISRFDYAAAQRETPGNYGAYVVRGNEVVLQLGGSPVETITAKRVGTDGLEIRSTVFKRGVRERPATP
ncbi:MAG TPA: hypothetical protein VHO24_07460 [Opitutaceae bacterium]|nr:hypothetical protein [Opitutaceae bacterium]